MKYLVSLMVCACLLTAAASAQIDPNTDGVGIYSDLGGMVNQVELEVGVPMEVYLLLTRPSGTGGLCGFECDIVVPDNVVIWGWNIPVPDAMSITSPPGFMAAWPEGIPYGSVNHLLTFIIVPQDSEPAQFFISGFSGGGEDFPPRYLDIDESRPHDDRALLLEMTPYPDGIEVATFTVNPDPTAVVSVSWGGVKSLFR